MLCGFVNSPSVDVLSGLVLVAFYEHGCGRMEGMFTARFMIVENLLRSMMSQLTPSDGFFTPK
jgi:hypothetical protein